MPTSFTFLDPFVVSFHTRPLGWLDKLRALRNVRMKKATSRSGKTTTKKPVASSKKHQTLLSLMSPEQRKMFEGKKQDV